MDNDLPGENWLEVKFDVEFTNDMRIEVSNCGRIRTFTKIAQGRILKGSTVNGYRIIRLKLFNERDEQTDKIFAYHKSQISKLTKKQAAIKRQLASKHSTDEMHEKLKTEQRNVQLLLDELKLQYRKKFHEDERKRTINYAQLIHRLVAEYFLEKPTPNHSIVIHADHNKLNNYYTNLKWVEPEECTTHQQSSPSVIAEKKKRIGRRPKSSKAFKLSESNVMLIKKKINNGISLKILSRQFKVTQTQLLRIKRGENWGDIKPAF